MTVKVWANSADPDQTAPKEAVWSGSSLFAISLHHFDNGLFVWILGRLQQRFLVSQNLETLH